MREESPSNTHAVSMPFLYFQQLPEAVSATSLLQNCQIAFVHVESVSAGASLNALQS